ATMPKRIIYPNKTGSSRGEFRMRSGRAQGRSAGSISQRDLERLVAEAQKRPGVAAMLEILQKTQRATRTAAIAAGPAAPFAAPITLASNDLSQKNRLG